MIVIGAGIAGLTASAILSQAGLRVLTLEEQERPGGYFQGFQRKGFTFDSSIQWLNNCNEGGFIANVFRFIGPDYPKCARMKHIRRYKGESFDYLLTSEPDLFRDQLIRDFPDERDGISRFFIDCKKNGAHFDVLRNRMRALETMPVRQRVIFGMRMLRWVVPVWKFLRVSAKKGLKRYFQSDAIQRLFCCEEKFMSIMMPFCWAYAGDFQSPPQGGAEAFVDWLCNKIAEPSRIMLQCRVDRVLVENGRATGVSLADGTTVHGRYIIAACDVESLYERMLPPGTVPEKMLRRLREADLYHSSVTVFLGLDCDSPVIGLGEELVSVTLDSLPREEHSAGDPHKNSLTVQAPSVRDKTLAPEGRSTLTIHCSARFDYENFWRTTGTDFERGEAYRDLKKRYADILIDRVEKALKIGIREHIAVMEVATPITYWRYTKNRYGSIMGASPTDKNIRNKLAQCRTPVKNLFLGGHWAVYGGGMPMAVKAAANASLLVLRQAGNPKFRELCAIMDGKAGD